MGFPSQLLSVCYLEEERTMIENQFASDWPSSSMRDPCLQYGGQVVPMAKEQELALKYGPDKDFSILGTVAQDSAPRHMWIGVSC